MLQDVTRKVPLCKRGHVLFAGHSESFLAVVAGTFWAMTACQATPPLIQMSPDQDGPLPELRVCVLRWGREVGLVPLAYFG